MSARLVCALTRHRYTAEVRELALVLWRSIADSPGSELDVPPDFVIRTPPAPVAVEATDPRGLTREQIVAALARVGGVRDRAWRELGLRSRDQLKRLLKKHDIS